MTRLSKFKSRSDLVITQVWSEIIAVHHDKATVVAVLTRFKRGAALVELSAAPAEVLRRLSRDYPKLRDIIAAEHRPEIVRLVYIDEVTANTRFVAMPIDMVH